MSEVEPADIRWSSIRFTRNNQSYRMLLSVCQLVIDGMLLTDERGEMRLMTYIKPQYMERLYEKFILEYYRKECGLAQASSPQIKWALDDGIARCSPPCRATSCFRAGKRFSSSMRSTTRIRCRRTGILTPSTRRPVPDLHLREEQGG